MDRAQAQADAEKYIVEASRKMADRISTYDVAFSNFRFALWENQQKIELNKLESRDVLVLGAMAMDLLREGLILQSAEEQSGPAPDKVGHA